MTEPIRHTLTAVGTALVLGLAGKLFGVDLANHGAERSAVGHGVEQLVEVAHGCMEDLEVCQEECR